MTKIAFIFLAAVGTFAQTFEVAAIKPATFPSEAYFKGFTAGAGACGKTRVTISGNRVTIEKGNACSLIRTAYDIDEYRIFNVPQWVLSKEPSIYYDVQAQAAEGVQITDENVKPMLQALLAERFHLKVHHEQREMPVYALVVGKNGHKLSTEPLKSCDGGKIPKVEMRGTGFGICQPTQTTAQIAFTLSREADRPVIDQTGLTGKYAFFLVYTAEDAQVQPNSAPGLFTAIQEQLGLKLEPTKTQFDVLVIDQLDKPTEN